MSMIILLELCAILVFFPDISITKRIRTTYQFKNQDIVRIYNASLSVPSDVQNYVPIYEAMTPPPWGEVNISDIFWNKTISEEPLIPASEFQKQPRFTWESDSNKSYLFFLSHIKVDFDVWGYYQYHHWVVGNIPGCQMDKGEEIIPYLPPIGQHGLWRPNYRLVVFQQPGYIDFEEKRNKPNRIFTTVDKFIAKYKMTDLDNLVASRTFFVDDDNGATTPKAE
ncbi:putative odorant-binding protein A5 [Planococcus citri]|uniref:putative odorant-binding protein A5 n=1 Tax=Planococcus citri TaxID=170843 RepID=UPI0031F8592D